MDISEETSDRLRATWAASTAVPDMFARLFYGRLFEGDPSLRALFKEDMASQGRKLVETVTFVVDHLDDAEVLLPAARDLAIRHVAYGVQPDHYDLVGAALIGTLEDLLTGDFTAEDLAAWSTVFSDLSTYMINSAHGA